MINKEVINPPRFVRDYNIVPYNISKNLKNNGLKGAILRSNSKIYMKEKKINDSKNELMNNYNLNSPLKDNFKYSNQELDELYYDKAVELDKRSFCKLLFIKLIQKISIINMFYFKKQYAHINIFLIIYINGIMVDIFLNCILYSDDSISEKYNNDGKLSFLTSFLISTLSNVISNFISFLLSKITIYDDKFGYLENKIININIYMKTAKRILKSTKIIIFIGFIFISILNVMCFYYIIIFVNIYQNTQISMIINYLYGILESIIFIIVICLLIVIIRKISIGKKNRKGYYTSKWIDEHF
jgi:hypothetical protein